MIQDDWFPLPGGGPVSTIELCTHLVANFDIEIDIYTRALNYEGEVFYTDEEPHEDITVYRLPPCTEYHNPVGRVAHLVSPVIFGPRDYDLVHAQCYVPAIPGKILSRLLDIPIVYTIRGTSIAADSSLGSTDGSPMSKVRKRIERLLAVDFDYDSVISVNRNFVQRFDDEHDNLSFIPNGVDTEKFRGSPPEEVENLLFVGRLVGKKRVDVILKAFAKLREGGEDLSLTIIGEGDLEDELHDLAVRLGITDDVEFLGRVPYEEIDDYYRNADLFVLPSEWEGHPRVMLEAWASSVPMVGTNVEGIVEFIEEGETGWMVPYDDVDALADQISWCIDNPEAVTDCGAAARDVIEAEYSWDAVAEQTCDIYADL